MSQTYILITGASRGLGQALVERFLALPNHTVIAANRTPTDTGSQSLHQYPLATNSSLIIVPYNAATEGSAFSAVKILREEHDIPRLDIVVGNAGISREYPLARDAKRAAVLEHVQVNVLGILELFQATRELLRNSERPIFAPMGSGAGYLGHPPPVPNSVYGPTKTMVFWYGVRINAEEEWLNTFVIDPGWVQTEMGDNAAQLLGVEGGKATLPVGETMDAVVRLLRTATKEKHGGRAVLYNGEVQEW